MQDKTAAPPAQTPQPPTQEKKPQETKSEATLIVTTDLAAVNVQELQTGLNTNIAVNQQPASGIALVSIATEDKVDLNWPKHIIFVGDGESKFKSKADSIIPDDNATTEILNMLNSGDAVDADDE
jgi:hypothetical protein